MNRIVSKETFEIIFNARRQYELEIEQLEKDKIWDLSTRLDLPETLVGEIWNESI